MSDEIVQANFRMPKSLKDKIETEAKNNNRSITAELVLRLEQSFDTDKYLELSDRTLFKISDENIDKLLDAMADRYIAKQNEKHTS